MEPAVRPRLERHIVGMLRDERGMSLTELVVVSILMVFVMAAIYSIFGTSQSIYNTIEGQNAATGDGARAMFQLTKETREMVDIQSSFAGGYEATPGDYRLAMRSDIDNDDEFENVMFEVPDDGSHTLVRYVNEPNSATVTRKVIARDVRNRDTDSSMGSGWTPVKLFTFYNYASQEITNTSAIPSKCYSVRIELVTDSKPFLAPAPLRLVTTIQRRNLPSG